ncbi:MAG TPA: MotA/TolQ/ExbB proton channel family protein [Myxococcota bacterium]|nr:MotA/TolQ/ExbB proton channel family protein [Myxococcota bacterium]
MGGFAAFFIEGGVWMLPIAAVSVVALAVAVERIIALSAYNTDGKALFGKVSAALQKHQDAEAIRACEQTGRSALGHVLKNVVVHADKGDESVATAVEEGMLEVSPGLLKRTGSLAGWASLATLLGLLGTVMGLIEAFRVVAEAPADQKSALLTKSIAVAMNTTAFGLLVAIPASIILLILMGVTKKIQDDMDLYSLKLEVLLKNRKRA